MCNTGHPEMAQQDAGERFMRLAIERRSSAYRWLYANRTWIEAKFIEVDGRPWTVLAEVALEQDGQKFAPGTLRAAWDRIERSCKR